LENLCPEFEATGADADGGYAEYLAVSAAFAHPIPDVFSDIEAAPLLCAGAIGWRSLRLAELVAGDCLALVGFGASGHLVMQLARHRHPDTPVYVFARSAEERAFAIELGAAWAGTLTDTPPTPVDAVIDTTPVWAPMVATLRHLAPAGRYVINAITKSDADIAALAQLDYARDLWKERVVRSVANVTRADVREVLMAAAQMRLHPSVEVLPLAQANVALQRLASGSPMRGAIVLAVADGA
jgi:propanol-preferring alcohol dehydrogenase